ncbi:MAG: restriction endonuclease subunit M [Planctomyces sp.]|nr:restriction endonuclease subunit M [Planctomyces sp.]
MDYSIEYPGKKTPSEVLSGERAEIQHFLALGRSNSGFRNRIYAGENLGVLRALCDDDDVQGKVSLVYIDPPFSTGSRLETRDSQHAYDDLFSGSLFLEFLRERLILLRELLASDGSLYLHLDAKKMFPMKVILDEIFGASNFRACITRKKSNRKNHTRNTFGNISDYILFYSRSSKYIWNRPYEPWTDANPPKEYRYIEEATGRRYMKVPVHAPGVRNGETGQPWRGVLPPPGKHWQLPPSALDELDAKGEIYWSPSGNPRRKVYLDQSKGVPVQDIWLDCKDAHNQHIKVTGYPTEKNFDMLRRIVSASSNPGDLVLDCFMGSGTTLAAAEDEGRRWIGIDSSNEAVDTTLMRLANGAEPMGDFVNGKAKQSASLFPNLSSSCDVFHADGCIPHQLDQDHKKRWRALFKS